MADRQAKKAARRLAVFGAGAPMHMMSDMTGWRGGMGLGRLLAPIALVPVGPAAMKHLFMNTGSDCLREATLPWSGAANPPAVRGL